MPGRKGGRVQAWVEEKVGDDVRDILESVNKEKIPVLALNV